MGSTGSKTMRSKLVPVLLEHAARRGADASRLADRFEVPAPCRRIEQWSLDAPAMPIDRIVALADAVAETLDDPWLGLSLAASLPRGVFGVHEFAVRNAPTLGEAALRLVRYQRLNNDAIVWVAERTQGATSLSLRVPGRGDGLGAHLNVVLVATALRYIRELARERLVPREVMLAHEQPQTDRAPWNELVGAVCTSYGARYNALVFAGEIWDRPVPEADPALLPVLERYARQLIPLEDATAGWPARARDYLRRQLSGGAPTLEQCAEAIGVAPRSLQRRLEETQTSYRALLDELREAEGRRLIAETDLPIDEVSFLLGYAERRSFVRAFTRWTGMSPSAYRAQRRGG
ncbi:MAG: AraC family transcriptional regulator ligand-binding domain-containing protein [Polyangiales bacterium]